VTELLGVLGGMGPLATAHFYRTLIELTWAENDQAHLPVVLWADPRVPDRTAALLGVGPSPVPALVMGVRWLQRAGAATIAVPCNTAHAFLPEVRRLTGASFLDMPTAALRSALAQVPGAARVGVLATRGTRLAAIYERAGEPLGLDICQVSEGSQRRLLDPAIAEIKAGGDRARARQLIADAAQELSELGAAAVVAGCSEIPLVAQPAGEIIPVIDATASLAELALLRMLAGSAANRPLA
jgi:aspartate racemase